MALHSMDWLTIIFRAIPILVDAAERLFGPKTGKVKKQFVANGLSGYSTITSGTDKTSTKQRETIEKTIDIVADTLFPQGEGNDSV